MKARLILGITEQISENGYERHYDTLDAEIVDKKYDKSFLKCDIIGGKWLDECLDEEMATPSDKSNGACIAAEAVPVNNELDKIVDLIDSRIERILNTTYSEELPENMLIQSVAVNALNDVKKAVNGIAKNNN